MKGGLQALQAKRREKAAKVLGEGEGKEISKRLRGLFSPFCLQCLQATFHFKPACTVSIKASGLYLHMHVNFSKFRLIFGNKT